MKSAELTIKDIRQNMDILHLFMYLQMHNLEVIAHFFSSYFIDKMTV